MIVLWLYIAFSYGWMLSSAVNAQTIEERWEWIIVATAPISFIIGIVCYLEEKTT